MKYNILASTWHTSFGSSTIGVVAIDCSYDDKKVAKGYIRAIDNPLETIEDDETLVAQRGAPLHPFVLKAYFPGLTSQGYTFV